MVNSPKETQIKRSNSQHNFFKINSAIHEPNQHSNTLKSSFGKFPGNLKKLDTSKLQKTEMVIGETRQKGLTLNRSINNATPCSNLNATSMVMDDETKTIMPYLKSNYSYCNKSNQKRCKSLYQDQNNYLANNIDEYGNFDSPGLHKSPMNIDCQIKSVTKKWVKTHTHFNLDQTKDSGKEIIRPCPKLMIKNQLNKTVQNLYDTGSRTSIDNKKQQKVIYLICKKRKLWLPKKLLINI